MKTKLYFYLLLGFLGVLGACYSEPADFCVNRTAQITHTWRMVGYNRPVDGHTAPDTIYYEHILSTGDYFIDYCVEGNYYPDRKHGTWALVNNETQVVFDEGTTHEEYARIDTLTCERLVMTFEAVNPFFGKHQLTYTLERFKGNELCK